MKKDYTKAYKIKMVEKYKKSNIKVSDFCKANEIPVSTFNRWVLEDKISCKTSANFGEISVESLNNTKNNISNNISKTDETNEIKLVMPNIEVSFKSGCSKKILQSLLEAILVD